MLPGNFTSSLNVTFFKLITYFHCTLQFMHNICKYAETHLFFLFNNNFHKGDLFLVLQFFSFDAIKSGFSHLRKPERDLRPPFCVSVSLSLSLSSRLSPVCLSSHQNSLWVNKPLPTSSSHSLLLHLYFRPPPPCLCVESNFC